MSDNNDPRVFLNPTILRVVSFQDQSILACNARHMTLTKRTLTSCSAAQLGANIAVETQPTVLNAKNLQALQPRTNLTNACYALVLFVLCHRTGTYFLLFLEIFKENKQTLPTPFKPWFTLQNWIQFMHPILIPKIQSSIKDCHCCTSPHKYLPCHQLHTHFTLDYCT